MDPDANQYEARMKLVMQSKPDRALNPTRIRSGIEHGLCMFFLISDTSWNLVSFLESELNLKRTRECFSSLLSVFVSWIFSKKMCAVATADRGFTWSDEETSLLLQLWGGNDAQSELTGNKRNFVVYEKISEAMNSLGFFRTASQCREKIKRMKREYTLTKQHNEKSSGGVKKSMRFYEQFEKILLEKQIRNQKNTTLKSCLIGNEIESELDESVCSKKTNWPVRNERKLRKLAPKSEQIISRKLNEPLEKEPDNLWTPDVVLVEETPSTSTAYENQSSISTNSVNGNHSKRKKRKMNSRLSLFKCMMDSLTLKFMKYQTESDVKLLSKIEELENEQTATDERIQKMWLEFEEKRLADEREHELKVMSTFQDIISQIKNSSK